MLAAWYKRQMVKEAREQGREEGLEEGLEQGREQGRAEGREEGLEEGLVKGRDQEREAWFTWTNRMQEWQQRRDEAEREGRPFHEPPPSAPGTEEDSAV